MKIAANHNNSHNAEEFLSFAGISPTSIRILVIKCLMESDHPLSLIDIERILETVERSSISRTLALLKNKELVHCFEDGSGSTKYELCQQGEHSLEDLHVHFRCDICGNTFCFSSLSVPEVTLPKGYIIKDINYVMTGYCPECQNYKHK